MIAFEQAFPLPGWFTAAGPGADVVISTRVRLARNLAGKPFPQRAALEERNAAFASITAAAQKTPLCKDCTVVNLLGQPVLSQQILAEERAISADMLSMQGDRGVIASTDRRIAIMVNEEDHLRMQVMASGLCGDELWKLADAIDSSLGKKLNFAWDKRRGFLTCCPTNAGTGLRVSFLMHLPGLTLTKTIDQVLQSGSQMGIATRGFFGEHSEIIGNLFQLSNSATMGATEEEFLASTQKLIERVVTLEHQARERIALDAKNEIVDKIWRSYGILRHSRSLKLDEFLNLSSAIRTGIEMKLFAGLTIPDLNLLTIVVMPAHVQFLRDAELDDRAVNAVRADIVREYMKGKVGE
jgi:protein arginine kinase